MYFCAVRALETGEGTVSQINESDGIEAGTYTGFDSTCSRVGTLVRDDARGLGERDETAKDEGDKFCVIS